ncbi:MAG: selenocysteine lyase/cysteine desulfurase [Cryomorphaceae bacterium]|jgi:selenocysteine lyase/cysteine desulfurase
MKLDLEFVRKQFNQLNDDPDLVFASNAGGSYVCNQVNEIFENYNRHTRVQPYNNFAPSSNAGLAMDRAKDLWAQALNIEVSELTVGPSTSMNTYVMANAISTNWTPGDEIVVTNQDHETNIGVWRRKADEKGVTIREWASDPETGLLNIEDLAGLLSNKTRWVFFTHCSNIVGTANPVSEITAEIKKSSSARVLVDAVAYAPHHISDMQTLGVDAYVFSLYKVFGPHQSLLYTSSDLQTELSSQAHYFLQGDVTKYLNPTGPQHAQVAACAGVIDYLDALHSHHFGAVALSSPQKMHDIHRLIQVHETNLTKPLVDYLANHKNVRLIGKPHTQDNDRAPTIAFRPLNQTSAELTATLQAANIGTEYGDFYATRLIEGVGIDPSDGVVRLSLLHYNSMQDVDKILRELDIALSA